MSLDHPGSLQLIDRLVFVAELTEDLACMLTEASVQEGAWYSGFGSA